MLPQETSAGILERPTDQREQGHGWRPDLPGLFSGFTSKDTELVSMIGRGVRSRFIDEMGISAGEAEERE